MNLDQILAAQNSFFNTNVTKDIKYRVAQLKKLKKVVQSYEANLISAVNEDIGKSEFETYATELAMVYQELNYCIKYVKWWSKKEKVHTGLANFPARSYILKEPLGSVLVIAAWNYPIYLSLIPAIAAISAGNTVILKPSEIPSKTSASLTKLVNENFPMELFHAIEGGVEETTALLKLNFDKIFFTGSTRVGKIVYQAAAKNLTPVTLELGGKSPAFVFADCHLKMAVKRLVWAKFINAGQTCVSPDYILVEASIKDKFLAAVKSEIEQNYPSSSEKTDHYSKIINEHNFHRLTELIDHSKLYCGGIIDAKSRFISPTVLSEVSWDDKIMEEEIFGPIMPVISFTDVEQTIARVKTGPKPLSCYVYSHKRKKINKILQEISFGGGAVNESVTHLSNSELPFGGVGLSGFGSYHGKAGFDNFSHSKGILDKPTWLELPIKYAPHKPWKLRVLKWLFG